MTGAAVRVGAGVHLLVCCRPPRCGRGAERGVSRRPCSALLATPPLCLKKHSAVCAKKGSRGAGWVGKGVQVRYCWRLVFRRQAWLPRRNFKKGGAGAAWGRTREHGSLWCTKSGFGVQEAGLAASLQLQLDSFFVNPPPKQLSTRGGEGCTELPQLGTAPLTLSLADCSVCDLEAVQCGRDLVRVEGGSVILVGRRCVGAQPCPCGLGVRR